MKQFAGLLALLLAIAGCMEAGPPVADADGTGDAGGADSTATTSKTDAETKPAPGTNTGTSSSSTSSHPTSSSSSSTTGSTSSSTTGSTPPPGNSTQNETSDPKPFEPTEPSGSCGGLGSLEPVAPNVFLVAGLATGWPLLELDIAVLADPTFVAAHPGDWQDLLRDLVADASVHYEAQLGLRLNLSVLDRLPDGSLAPGTGDGLQRAVGRGFMYANHPGADVDAVAVILGADYEGTTAGQVECVHGAGNPDYSYLWAEYDETRGSYTFVADPLLMFEDTPLKVFMHELAHLLAAHHHYSTCGRAVRTSDLSGVCDVMINDIGLASFEFSPTNRLVMRSFVEELGIGRPVP